MTLPIHQYFPNASKIAYGCMGLGGGWENKSICVSDIDQAHQVVDQALASGINFFDHADIYTHGKAERVFGEVIAARPELKDQLIIQSKCGIRFNDQLGPGRYDSSPEWITQSVESILSRLNIECLDILMLHRPDPLMEPERIAETFNQLIASGKVKHFGVSNMNQSQVHFLQQHIKQPLIADQVEISLKNLNWLDEGVMVGMNEGASNNFSSGTIEHCRLNNIQIQAWGSLCQGLFSGANLSGQPEHYSKTAGLVSQLAEYYDCGKEAILLAWLMRHPANIQPVIGTTNLERIDLCGKATQITLTREHWYQLYVSARGNPVP